MSDEKKMSGHLYERYEQMTTEELAAVLRADSEEGNGFELDSETLLYVMRLYAQRRTDKPAKTAEEAFAAFRRDYLPRVHEPSVWTQEDAPVESAGKRHGNIKLWRSMAAAAAALALVLSLGTLAQSHFNKAGRPIYWQNRDYLFVSSNFSAETVPNIPQIAQKWYPQWLPEDFEQVHSHCEDEYYGISYHRIGSGELDTLNIHFSAFDSGGTKRFFKNPEEAVFFIHDGVRFYRYTNVERVCAVGYLEGVLVFVDGMISEEELLHIVQSMQLD